MREQPFSMMALLLQTSFILINGVALPAYIHISLKEKKKKNAIIPLNKAFQQASVGINSVSLNNLLPHLHALVHSASGLYQFLLFTWHQFICNKGIPFIQNPIAGCMQHTVDPRCNNSVYLGENWKLLEVWQQLIRCCHCRALTTKSKQYSFETTGIVKYWGGDPPPWRNSGKCFGSMSCFTEASSFTKKIIKDSVC